MHHNYYYYELFVRSMPSFLEEGKSVPFYWECKTSLSFYTKMCRNRIFQKFEMHRCISWCKFFYLGTQIKLCQWRIQMRTYPWLSIVRIFQNKSKPARQKSPYLLNNSPSFLKLILTLESLNNWERCPKNAFKFLFVLCCSAWKNSDVRNNTSVWFRARTYDNRIASKLTQKHAMTWRLF